MISSINKKYFLMAVSGTKIGKQTDMDIAVRCPICGDSSKNERMTRLHLFHKNGKDGIKCFNGCCQLNEGVYNTWGFLKSFYPNLLDSYKREAFQSQLYNLNNTTSRQNTSDIAEDVFSNIIENTETQESSNNLKNVTYKPPVITHNLFEYFEDIIEHEEALEYLLKRGFNYYDLPYNWYFGTQDLKIGEKLYKLTNSIIIPLYYKKEMYGFYSRNIYNKEFFTYNPEQNIGYKIWNWFNIDKTKEVLITEGIFDALSINNENKIACMSAKIPQERLNELEKPIFVLDNDRTGILNSIEYVKKGYLVYIQPSQYKEKDMNELKINNPELDIYNLIKNNLYTGISAEVRLKAKL